MEQEEQQEKPQQGKLKTGAASPITNGPREGSELEAGADAEKEGGGETNSNELVRNQARGGEYISAGEYRAGLLAF